MINIKRICFPLLGFNISGGVRIIISVANGLAARGHNVKIIVPDYAAEVPFDLSERIEVKIVRTSGRGGLRKLHYFLKLNFISARKCDICFATAYITPYYVYISKLLNKESVKVVYLVQHYEPLSHANQSNKKSVAGKFFFLLAKFSYRLPFEKIAVSNWIKEKIGMKSVTVVSNGVDTKVFMPKIPKTPTDEFVVGTVGSPAPFKGYDVFLKGIQSIGATNSDGMKVIVASQYALRLPPGVKAELIRPANDQDMKNFYTQCDIFVFTSFIEGFGLPPLEAMACGVPVITTDCGGIRDFANSDNALVIPTGDPTEIGVAIIKLRGDANLREILSSRGLATARNSTIEKMILKYCRLVEGM